MSEISPPPVMNTRIHDKDLAWDMAHAAKPHWEAARDANEEANQAQNEILDNYQGLSEPTETLTPTDVTPEINVGTEQLREWVHNYKFYVHGTLNGIKSPQTMRYETGRPELEYRDLGSMPKNLVSWFSKNMSTNAHLDGQLKVEEFDKKFNQLGVKEKLTIRPVGEDPQKNLYRVIDPDSKKAAERIVAIVYERNGTRALFGRSSNLRFTLALPQSEADVFSRAVVENPSLIRELVDIAMLEELTLGDSWSGPGGTGSGPTEMGNKLAIRTDFTQGPDNSLIVPFKEAA